VLQVLNACILNLVEGNHYHVFQTNICNFRVLGLYFFKNGFLDDIKLIQCLLNIASAQINNRTVLQVRIIIGCKSILQPKQWAWLQLSNITCSRFWLDSIQYITSLWCRSSCCWMIFNGCPNYITTWLVRRCWEVTPYLSDNSIAVPNFMTAVVSLLN
jgi:hypothetical protein